VTQFMVEMTDPRLGEKVLDPACGTGGFLVCTLDHIRGKKEVKTAEDNEALQLQIHGVEKKPLPHMLCITNMILHGVEVPQNIRRDNTLTRPLRDYKPKDYVDVVVTNPPFGGIEEDGIQYNFPANFQTKETADLFLVLIMSILKPGGRCAIVLPDGTLFGEGVKTRIKEKLLDTCNLHTVVRLPNGVFSPYTGIKTNLLFFTRGERTKEVWYYEHPYPPGYKSYSKTKPMRIEEFEPEKGWWDNRVENEFAWKVPVEEIKANDYNLDIKNPNKPGEDHGDPQELLAEYQKLEADIEATRSALKKELRDSLGVGKFMKFFFDHFDILADAPNGIKNLRELILQLAVMGKLVPQDPGDEPAEVLFEKIKQEKEQLIKEGKIKRQKPLPPITDDEKPFELPKSWEWVKLAQISKIIHYGYTASADNTITNVRLLRITDIQNDKVNWESVPGCKISDSNLKSYELKNGDLLIARTGGTIGKTYLVQNLSVCAVFASYLIRAVPYSFIYPKFLKCFTGSFLYWKQLYSKCSGTGQPNVNGRSLSDLFIPMPPFNEQKRIVAKVEQLLSLCDRLAERLEEADSKREKLFQAVVNQVPV
jgi:type I restriction enzyme M protein